MCQQYCCVVIKVLLLFAGVVKRRIYKIMRLRKTDNWIEPLQEVTKSLNEMSRPQLGLEKAESIHSLVDEPRIRVARKRYAETLSARQKKKLFPPYPTWKEMQKNSQATESLFKVGDYCYLDNLRKSALSKSYHPQRLQIYLVTKVFRSIIPHQFELYNLLGEKKKGTYYAAQMRKTTSDPADRKYWSISKVVRRKQIEKKVLFQCRYEGYGRKFDELLPASRIPKHILRLYRQTRRAKEGKKEEEEEK